MGQEPAAARISLTCKARPEAVYDVLADLRTHLEWGGARQSGDFRLQSLEASAGPGTVGTNFSGTGTIPMSARRWEDRSTVTIATSTQLAIANPMLRMALPGLRQMT